jgi:hypothetical protein
MFLLAAKNAVPSDYAAFWCWIIRRLPLMIDTNSPAFREQYPNGAIVRDRLGRILLGVVACNPETGEVIKGTMTEGGRVETRQTWPAPLTIERCPNKFLEMRQV